MRSSARPHGQRGHESRPLEVEDGEVPAPIDPRTISRSHDAAGPTYSSVAQSARSDQKYGTSAKSAGRPATAAAARRPALGAGDLPVLDPHAAAVQHGVVLAGVARAPDARRRRSSVEEQATPPVSPSARPEERASMTSGTAPVPITTRSASISRPDSVSTAATRSSPTNPPAGRRDELDAPGRSRAPTNAPTCGPSGSRAASSSITIVQRLPTPSARPRPRRRCRSRPSARPARPSASARIASALPSARR